MSGFRIVTEIFFSLLKRYSENEGLECSKAFYNNGLMRMKLTADGTKMVISTTNAYIMIIHDLCLETLAKDLKNFKVSPSTFWSEKLRKKLLKLYKSCVI